MNDDEITLQTPVRVRCDAPVPELLRGEMGQVWSEPWIGQSGTTYVDVVLFGGLRESFQPDHLEVWRKPWEACNS